MVQDAISCSEIRKDRKAKTVLAGQHALVSVTTYRGRWWVVTVGTARMVAI